MKAVTQFQRKVGAVALDLYADGHNPAPTDKEIAAVMRGEMSLRMATEEVRGALKGARQFLRDEYGLLPCIVTDYFYEHQSGRGAPGDPEEARNCVSGRGPGSRNRGIYFATTTSDLIWRSFADRNAVRSGADQRLSLEEYVGPLVRGELTAAQGLRLIQQAHGAATPTVPVQYRYVLPARPPRKKLAA
ncbi:MAG TPA: hypothetical protein VFG23_02075 [Polyangia bacterium]|nr:hypothetical protein [Polyangia bacterium]